jgi:transcriptional regulator with XRE-family HTH domain/tetratricopeptide (TPR) repeat protein
MPDRGRPPSNELPIGQRVAYWRGRRNLTQQLFADRLGKSKSWVEKVERGARTLDRYSVIHEVAGVLRVDIQQLLANSTPRRRGGRGPANDGDIHARDGLDVDGVRTALERYLSVGWCLDGTREPPPLPELRKTVAHAWLTFQHGGYARLTQGLPRLLRDAQAADAYHRIGDESREPAHLLAQVYQVTSSVLRKVGEPELARLAADRSIAASLRTDDPLLAGTATYRAGNALLALGRPRPALETHLGFAHRLAPGGAKPSDPARLSVYGILLLQGAMAAATLGDDAAVDDLFQAAEEAASAVGPDQNHYRTSFGPTNVQLHRVAAAVELGDGRRAVRFHSDIDPQALRALPPERQAHHLLDLARAYTQVGDVASAGDWLVEAARLCPSEIRYRPVARGAITEIVRRTRGAPPAHVAELARRMGMVI